MNLSASIFRVRLYLFNCERCSSVHNVLQMWGKISKFISKEDYTYSSFFVRHLFALVFWNIKLLFKLYASSRREI